MRACCETSRGESMPLDLPASGCKLRAMGVRLALSLPVLIVDDDADVRDAMEFLLRSEGYRTVTAADGDDALTKLRAGLEPCLILLDLMMPWKDGFQFRREQMRDPRLSAIPVVVLSGRHQPEI